jgi:hypothetical protein
VQVHYDEDLASHIGRESCVLYQVRSTRYGAKR